MSLIKVSTLYWLTGLFLWTMLKPLWRSHWTWIDNCLELPMAWSDANQLLKCRLIMPFCFCYVAVATQMLSCKSKRTRSECFIKVDMYIHSVKPWSKSKPMSQQAPKLNKSPAKKGKKDLDQGLTLKSHGGLFNTPQSDSLLWGLGKRGLGFRPMLFNALIRIKLRVWFKRKMFKIFV